MDRENPRPLEQARLLDIERSLRSARAITGAATLLALIAAGPFIGWWTLGAFVPSMLALLASDRLAYRSFRPETVIFNGLMVATAAGAVMAGLSGGVRSPLLVLTAVPIASLGIRFRGRRLVAGVLASIAAVLVACLIADPARVAADPAPLFFVITAAVSVAALTSTVQQVELDQRAEAVLDPLTGLFNRKRLRQRFEELSAQARLTGQPLALIAGDIDNFKAVNDRFGHAHGDVVLKDVAYSLRKALRRFELLFRFGGEEFIALLPGVDTAEAAVIAERMRADVEGTEAGATMSFGVAVSQAGALTWEQLFESADERLYLAKHRGRNRVVTDLGDTDQRPVALQA
jgi:diguanylate cyclase (GGDEF)-like protein